MSASKNIDIRDAEFAEAKLNTSTFITTATAGYRAVDKDQLSLDLLAGTRINAMKTGLDLKGPRDSFSGSKKETWIDPIIAVRFKAPLGQNWWMRTYGDIGGLGVG